MTLTWTTTMWLGDVEQVDHVEVGTNRFTSLYREGKPRHLGELTAFLEQVQNFENVTFEALTGIWPLTAVGNQLDTLGEIVGQTRGELLDEEYRAVILGRILVNRSRGKIEDLLKIIDAVGYTGTVEIVDSHPAGLMITVSGTDHGWILGDLLGDAKAGGVSLFWAWSAEDDADCFACSNTLNADEADANAGFGDLDGTTQTTGGYLMGDKLL